MPEHGKSTGEVMLGRKVLYGSGAYLGSASLPAMMNLMGMMKGDKSGGKVQSAEELHEELLPATVKKVMAMAKE